MGMCHTLSDTESPHIHTGDLLSDLLGQHEIEAIVYTRITLAS